MLTYFVVLNSTFTFSMETYSSPSRIWAFGTTLAWMSTFSILKMKFSDRKWEINFEHWHYSRWHCYIPFLPKVRLANPFPVIGKNNTLPAIEYFPTIVSRFVLPNTSNFDVLGSFPKPLVGCHKQKERIKTNFKFVASQVAKVNSFSKMTFFESHGDSFRVRVHFTFQRGFPLIDCWEAKKPTEWSQWGWEI